jgi:hypothetical protein
MGAARRADAHPAAALDAPPRAHVPRARCGLCRHPGAIALATLYGAPDFMGPAYWIPAFWVPALLVTNYLTFVLLLKKP